MFGFFSFSNAKNYIREKRQVYFLSAVIIFIGFLSGAFYSNALSQETFGKYAEILSGYVKNGQTELFGGFNLSSDVKNLLLIFFWSFFLFGKPFSGFFAFKSGFSVGFYISFFVKVYSLKGFFTGMCVLFLYVIFALLPLAALTALSFEINSEITASTFGHSKSKIKETLPRYLLVFLLALLSVLLGNHIASLILPKIIAALFGE